MDTDALVHKDIQASGSNIKATIGDAKRIEEKIDSVSLAVAYLTDLITRVLEEKKYAAIRERERRW